MNPETINSIKEALVPLAEKLGQGASFVYEVSYRQTIIDGITGVVVGGVILLATLILGIWVVRELFKGWAEADMYDREDSGITIVLAIIAGLVVVGISLAVVVDAVKKLANPHYYTIQSIIHEVRK